ncbi:hypothetical protein EZS27_020562 [termite gut metagenome]|uniref:Uncharacterized protein n=1 Tax=termite gut metagenome TaxID=433724 RepID=A0A5J4RB33_9ZZZZ
MENSLDCRIRKESTTNMLNALNLQTFYKLSISDERLHKQKKWNIK